MSLQNISNTELISRMGKLVRTERKITHLILLHIAEIEVRKLYADLGYDSMYSYLTKELGYSEGSAYRRLQSARLLKSVPEVAAKVEDGSLKLSQLTQVQKCLKERTKSGASATSEMTLEVLSKIENKNSFETQKTLAAEFNLPIQNQELLKPQQDSSVRLELTLTAEQFAQLEQAKSLLSHICPDGSWADVIATLAQSFNSKKLEGRKTTTQGAHAKKGAEKAKAPSVRKRLRQYISVQTKRELLRKAQHQCEFRNPTTQQRCDSKYQLELDHIHPWALNGSSDPANLRVLCRTHNVLAAERKGLFYRPRPSE